MLNHSLEVAMMPYNRFDDTEQNEHSSISTNQLPPALRKTTERIETQKAITTEPRTLCHFHKTEPRTTPVLFSLAISESA